MAEMVKGFFLKTPHENAPDWVKRKVSVNVEQFSEYLRDHANEKGFVNFDLKEAKTGHWYLQLDKWKPSINENSDESPAPEVETFTPYTPPPKPFEDDVPF